MTILDIRKQLASMAGAARLLTDASIGAARSRASAYIHARGGRREQPILLVPPADPGSLGDEAMLTVAMTEIARMGGSRLTILYRAKLDEWRAFVRRFPGIDVQFIQHANSLRGLARSAVFRQPYSRCLVIGADLMDGGYGVGPSHFRWNLVRVVALMGVPATILGFSFNEAPAQDSVKQLGRMPRSVTLKARDPRSLERLMALRPRCRVQLVADTAFLLPIDPSGREAQRFDAWASATGGAKTLVGLNPNYALIPNVTKMSDAAIVDLFASPIRRWLSREPTVAVALLPHERRTMPERDLCEFSLSQRLYDDERLAAYRHRIFCPSVAIQPSEIKYVCSRLAFAITGRMHVAIAALGAGTPAYCLKYQGKFEGLLELFGLEDWCVAPEEVLREERLQELVSRLLPSAASYREKVSRALPRVQAMAAQNYELS